MHSQHQNLVINDCRELGVSEGEGPETEIGGSVGHSSEHKLNGVDRLVHEHLSEVEILTIVTMPSATTSIVPVSVAGVLRMNTLVTCLLQNQ